MVLAGVELSTIITYLTLFSDGWRRSQYVTRPTLLQQSTIEIERGTKRRRVEGEDAS